MCTSCPVAMAFKHPRAASYPASCRELPLSPCRRTPFLRELPVVPANAGGGCHHLAWRHGLATGSVLLLVPSLAALHAASLGAALPALLAAPLTAAPAVTALATPLDRVDAGGLVFILLALHHGDCSAVLMPMQGKQAVCFCRQPPDVVLVVALQLNAQPGREPL
jgi:hypothetical protein